MLSFFQKWLISIASFFGYAIKDATVCDINTMNNVLIFLVTASPAAYPKEDATMQNFDIWYHVLKFYMSASPTAYAKEDAMIKNVNIVNAMLKFESQITKKRFMDVEYYFS